MWPPTEFIEPLPPFKRKMPGRPKVNRRKDASEMGARHTVSKVRKKIMCSVCMQVGHNKVTCSQAEKPTKLKVKKRKRTDGKDCEGSSGKKEKGGKNGEGTSGKKGTDGKDGEGSSGMKGTNGNDGEGSSGNQDFNIHPNITITTTTGVPLPTHTGLPLTQTKHT
ncbi:unnamed protein product [Lactuca virosa]|uniref:Uncharacterized protein n=1 Tax=Lactuca virosa TaxID=75947 RepID=A0AAU9MQY4_9ASTR|nr:unnamed protein product [Lactuca virosa]